jgi:hypothetical protein
MPHISRWSPLFLATTPHAGNCNREDAPRGHRHADLSAVSCGHGPASPGRGGPVLRRSEGHERADDDRICGRRVHSHHSGEQGHKDNSLSFNGEFATGYGIADLYTGLTGGLTGGVGFPSPANPMGLTPAPTFKPDIDAGIVTYDANGGLHGVQWTTYLMGAQYCLPGVDGKLMISGNFSHIMSANSHYYGTASALTSSQNWGDVNVFYDPVPAVRVGLEFANFNTTYVDLQHASNQRVQLSGFFIF